MVEVEAEMETDLSGPTLRGETTDGWDPSLEDDVQFATA